MAHVLKLQYPGALEIADSSTLAAQPPSLQCEPLAAVTVGIRSEHTTTSKGIFQFLAGVSFVFVVWNPIFCMVFPVHIVLNIGGFQAWSHKKIEVSGHIF